MGVESIRNRASATLETCKHLRCVCLKKPNAAPFRSEHPAGNSPAAGGLANTRGFALAPGEEGGAHTVRRTENQVGCATCCACGGGVVQGRSSSWLHAAGTSSTWCGSSANRQDPFRFLKLPLKEELRELGGYAREALLLR